MFRSYFGIPFTGRCSLFRFACTFFEPSNSCNRHHQQFKANAATVGETSIMREVLKAGILEVTVVQAIGIDLLGPGSSLTRK